MLLLVSILILVKYFPFVSSCHLTSINLSLSLTLKHSTLWTVIPLFLVINPTILSPGIGLQQEAILTLILSIPATFISRLFLIIISFFRILGVSLG